MKRLLLLNLFGMKLLVVGLAAFLVGCQPENVPSQTPGFSSSASSSTPAVSSLAASSVVVATTPTPATPAPATIPAVASATPSPAATATPAPAAVAAAPPSPAVPSPVPTLCSDFSGKLAYYSMKSVPVISPTESKLNATTGNPIASYEATVSDGTSIDSYSIDPSLPPGLDLNLRTGRITGSPTEAALDGELFTVTVNYTDFSNASKQAACIFTYSVSASDVPGTFSATGGLNTPRNSALAVTLANGKILVVGGKNGGSYLNTAELYDPLAGTFSYTGSMSQYAPKTATLLQDGTVIVSGGYTDAAGTKAEFGIEIYDPATAAFTFSDPSLGYPSIAAVLMENGKVLFLEGPSSCDPASGTLTRHAAEIYDPTIRTVSPAGFYGGTSATALQNGKVLIRGIQACGRGAVFREVFRGFIPNAYLYDPTKMTFTETARAYDYSGLAPTPSQSLVLSNEKVLFSEYLGNYVQLMESYDSSEPSWDRPYGIVENYNFSQTPTPLLELPDGTVLIVDFGYSVAHFYSPSSTKFTADHAHLIYNHGAAPAFAILANGKPLIIGGEGVEYYNP